MNDISSGQDIYTEWSDSSGKTTEQELGLYSPYIMHGSARSY